MNKYTKLSEECVSFFKETLADKGFPLEIKYVFVGNTKQKKVISITKIPDKYAFLLDAELLVSVNEELFSTLVDDLKLKILFEQEINKIGFDLERGKVKLEKPDLTLFDSMVNKYGLEKIKEANDLESLTFLSINEKGEK